MTVLAFQIGLILLLAFFAGCAVGCWLSGCFGGSRGDTPVVRAAKTASRAGGRAAARPKTSRARSGE